MFVVCQAREQFVKMEDHFKTELASQSKLAVLYKVNIVISIGESLFMRIIL